MPRAKRAKAKAKSAGSTAQKTRLAKLQKALASETTFDALDKVRELIPDDGAGAQEVVVHGFACILETNSAGLTMLFDRFDAAELPRIHASLESIGATRTLTALRKLQKLFDRAVADGSSRLDAASAVAESPDARAIDRQRQAQVAEMEEKLLTFCKAHLRDLWVRA